MNGIQARNELLRNLQKVFTDSANMAESVDITLNGKLTRYAEGMIFANREAARMVGAMMTPERDMTDHDLYPKTEDHTDAD